jgi:uncharacterized protein
MRVTALYYYPIKSCGGTALESATIVERGFVEDRAWMVTDADGVFQTQREMPRLALIRPRLTGDGLVLSAPGMPPLTVVRRPDGARREVAVWDDRCATVDQGAEPADWLSTFLGAPCRLVRMVDDFVRATDPAYSAGLDGQVGFADGYPFLLTTEASLADLNGRMAEPLPMNRFRPNIVVAGSPPYAEDGWRRIRIGGITFAVVKPCARCAITTVDQATAAAAREPLRTLATYRQVRGEGVMFGQNLIHTAMGTVHVGDAMEIVEADAVAIETA